MSIDEQREQELYDAMARVWGLPHPVQKRRIFKNALRMIMMALGITKAELKGDDDETAETRS